jgi:glycosyltransferase involved in cell wall biosynthesis
MAHEGSTARLDKGRRPAASTKTVAPVRAPETSGLVVIPARDEAADVAGVVRKIRELGLPVVVVDDYSSDRTAEIARAAGATVLRMPFHGGAWAAIQTGMRHALAHGYDFVITIDADGQHEPAEISTLIDAMVSASDVSVVIGACPTRANSRRRIAWRLLRWLSGLDVEDLTSGFRVYDRRAIALLAHEQHALFEYQDVGVLLCLREHGLPMREVPVKMRPRLHGASRIFSSWPMVAYYLAYSVLVGGSRRGRQAAGTRD